MDYIYAAIVGLIHGLCGILPVSEVGHLQILKKFTDLGGAEAAVGPILPLAVLAAVVLVFHKTVWQMLLGLGTMIGGAFNGRFKWRKASKYQLMAVYLLIAAVPMGIVAFIRQFFSLTENLLLIGAMLLVTAGIIFIGTHSLCRVWTMLDMKPGHALKLGLFQAAAVFLPGLSRSGVTYSMGMNMGFDRETAMEFSFMLSIPALLTSFLMNLGGFSAMVPLSALVAAGVALLAGVGACLPLRALIRKDRFGIFLFYTAALGIAALVINFI